MRREWEIGPLPSPITRLIGELSKLPGIGPKTAARLAFHLLKLPLEEIESLAEALLDLKRKVRFCSVCQNITDQDPCSICSDPSRDSSVICVVEKPLDVISIERTRSYQGLYHVLHGMISPLEGIGPEDLKIEELLRRLEEGEVREVILALNPSPEGETTSHYLYRLISPLGIKVTTLARGLPTGGELEFADELTISQALRGRREFEPPE